jgi:hypothetical protein
MRNNKDTWDLRSVELLAVPTCVTRGTGAHTARAHTKGVLKAGTRRSVTKQQRRPIRLFGVYGR